MLFSSLMLLASCASQPNAGPVAPEELRPSVSIEFTRPAAFGDLVEAVITVTNSTFDAILVKSVEFGGQLPWFSDQPFSLPGRLQERRNEYVHDPEAPGETPPVFTGEWLLFPAEAQSIRERYRARFFRETVAIHFRRIPLGELSQEAYFPVSDPHQRSRTRFRRVPQSRLGEYRRDQLGAPDRVLILPGEESWPVETAEQNLEIFLPAPGLPAGARLPAGSALTRWLGKQSWIIDDPQSSATFGIDAAGRRFELPRCDLRVFDVLDLFPPGEPIPVYRHGVRGPPETIASQRAAAFLEEARAAGKPVAATWKENDLGRFDYALLIDR